jgi:DNA-binding MarR family transcriptional regulator
MYDRIGCVVEPSWLYVRTMSRSGSEALQDSVSRFVRIFGLLDRERTPCGLDLHISEAHLISDVASDGPLGQKQLCERLHLAKSTVSRLVGQLIERGWLQREPAVADGRAVLVSLTGEGRVVAERLRRARARRFSDLLAAVPDERRCAVIDAVRFLADAAGAARQEVSA